MEDFATGLAQLRGGCLDFLPGYGVHVARNRRICIKKLILLLSLSLFVVTCTNFPEINSLFINDSGQKQGSEGESAGTGRAAESTTEKTNDESGIYEIEEVWIDSPLESSAAVQFYGEIADSRELARIILMEAKKHSIPAPLVFALVRAESSFNPWAVNRNSGSVDRGLFQLNSRSFPSLARKEFFDPMINAQYGTAYLRMCLDAGENEVVALAMYNAGKRRVDTHGTPRMTLNYIAKVLDYRDKIEESIQERISYREERHVLVDTRDIHADAVDSAGRNK